MVGNDDSPGAAVRERRSPAVTGHDARRNSLAFLALTISGLFS